MKKYSSYSSMAELLQPGVFAFVHARTKAMYLTYSNNMLAAIGTHLQSAQESTHICPSMNKQFKNLRLYIIETCTSRDNAKEQFGYWYRELSKIHKMYNRVPPTQYRVRVEIDNNAKRIFVKLVSNSNSQIVLGVFNKIEEAETFATVVRSQDYLRPIYSTNSLTISYLQEQRQQKY